MHQKPHLCLEEVPVLVRDFYGIEVSVEKELNSYDDRVYLVQESNQTDEKQNRYAFKVLNAIDSMNEDVIGNVFVWYTHLKVFEFIVSYSFFCLLIMVHAFQEE